LFKSLADFGRFLLITTAADSYGQAMSSFGPASANDLATATGSHACAKTVRTLTLDVARLKSLLHDTFRYCGPGK
jgi:hypothetical protein